MPHARRLQALLLSIKPGMPLPHSAKIKTTRKEIAEQRRLVAVAKDLMDLRTESLEGRNFSPTPLRRASANAIQPAVPAGRRLRTLPRLRSPSATMPAPARRLHNLARTLSAAAAAATPTAAAAQPNSAPAVRCVVACGRGRDICAPAIRDTIVSLAQRRTASSAAPSMLYLGTPAFEATDALELQTTGFAKVGCPIRGTAVQHNLISRQFQGHF